MYNNISKEVRRHQNSNFWNYGLSWHIQKQYNWKSPQPKKNHPYSVDDQRGISNFILLLFHKNPSKIGLDRNVNDSDLV